MIHGKATFAELSSTLSLEDLYDILEIIKVDHINTKIMRDWAKRNDS